MGSKYSRVRGTNDFFFKEGYLHSKIEQVALQISRKYGFSEVKTPILEETNLFIRSMGETSDVAKKEMYNFKDKGDRDVCMRPEWTAGIARAVVENKLLNNTNTSLKLVGCGPVFRYDRPQAGRYRQFDQLSFEWINSNSIFDDIEVILLFNDIMKALEISGVYFVINNIGSFDSRKKWIAALQNHLEQYKDQLSELGRERLIKNPLRILDDKIDGEKDFVKNAPKITEFLSQEEKDNFVFIQTVLFNFGVKCVVDVNLVRGLDYYTDLVFEVKSNCVSGSLGGGGRYSNLIKEIGGNDCSCIGFGLGVERVMNVMIEQNIYIDDYGVDIFVAKIDDSVEEESFELIHSLRKNDFSVTSDFSKNKLSSLFSIAEKCKAKYIVIVGKKDIENGVFTVKNQKTLKQEIIKKNEILEYFKKNI